MPYGKGGTVHLTPHVLKNVAVSLGDARWTGLCQSNLIVKGHYIQSFGYLQNKPAVKSQGKGGSVERRVWSVKREVI